MKSISNALKDYCKDVPSQEIRISLENRGYKPIDENSQIMCYDFDENEDYCIYFESEEELEKYLQENELELSEN